MDDEALHGYMKNHWVAAAAGLELFHRVGRNHRDPEAAAAVRRLAGQVEEDRETLRQLMLDVGANPSRVGTVSGRIGARLGQLKPNGRILTRPPLTDVIELEGLRLAVTGKGAGWEVLRKVADSDHRLDVGVLEQLQSRNARQLSELEQLHLTVSARRLRGSDSSATG